MSLSTCRLPLPFKQNTICSLVASLKHGFQAFTPQGNSTECPYAVQAMGPHFCSTCWQKKRKKSPPPPSMASHPRRLSWVSQYRPYQSGPQSLSPPQHRCEFHSHRGTIKGGDIKLASAALEPDCRPNPPRAPRLRSSWHH